MATRRADVPARERLTRERIVDCAIALADVEGLDAVTIRRLAQDQGVTPMALYWHFKDKELLLDGVAERLLSQVRLPDPRPGTGDGAWHERLRAVLAELLVVLRAHPALADLVRGRILGCEAGLELSERAFAALKDAGFDVERRAQIGMQALHTMVLLVTTEPGQRVGNESAEAGAQRMRTKKAALQALSPGRYPNVLDCADPMTAAPSESEYFALGLDLFIAGVRGVRPPTSA